MAGVQQEFGGGRGRPGKHTKVVIDIQFSNKF